MAYVCTSQSDINELLLTKYGIYMIAGLEDLDLIEDQKQMIKDGNITKSQLEMITAHLPKCSECRRTYDSLLGIAQSESAFFGNYLKADRIQEYRIELRASIPNF